MVDSTLKTMRRYIVIESFERTKEKELVAEIIEKGISAMEGIVAAIFKDDYSFLEATKSRDLADFFMSERCLEESESDPHETAMMWLLDMRHRKDLGVTPDKFARLIMSFCRHVVEVNPEINAASIMRANFLNFEPWEENSVFQADRDEEVIVGLISTLIDDRDPRAAENALLLLSGVTVDDFHMLHDHGKSNDWLVAELKKKAIMLGPSIIALKLIKMVPFED